MTDTSRRSYTKHVPDIRLITHYAEGTDSVIHRVNPWTKAAMLFFIVALVTVVMDFIILAVIYMFALGFYTAAKLPLKLLVGWYFLPLVFVLTLVIMFVFTEPGTEIARMTLGPLVIAVTDNGLVLVAKLVIRALAVVTFSLAVFMTISYRHVVYIARRSMPGPLATMFLLTYRFLYVTSDEMTDLLDAVHSKNGNMVRGVLRQTRMFAGIFAHTFIHAFDRADRVSKAMEARGFTGDFPIVERVSAPRAREIAVVGAFAVFLALALVSRYSGMAGW
ncbi:MAG TPA: energy-coupling factor transporter transmembrane component T [Thermoplasmata archaeon]|nr:energy-coupling factor transporter transmembrane component T [Thermoplasmata archaeon]